MHIQNTFKIKKNYSVTDLEELVIIFSIYHFRQHILSSKNPTNFIADHKPLHGLFKKSIPTSNRHARWIEEFNKYRIDLVYEKEKKNVFADALSRLPSKNSNEIVYCANAILADFNPRDLDLPRSIIKYFTKIYQVVNNTSYYKKKTST